MLFLVDCVVFPLRDTWFASSSPPPPDFLSWFVKFSMLRKLRHLYAVTLNAPLCIAHSSHLFFFISSLPPPPSHVFQKENLRFLLKTEEKLKNRDTKTESTPRPPSFSPVAGLCFCFTNKICRDCKLERESTEQYIHVA